MNSPIVQQKPNYPPYVCLQCGVGDDRRKWYVDLQLNIEFYLNPVNDGAAILCNECWESLATSIVSQAQHFLFGLEPWNTGEFVPPTYDNEETIEVIHANPIGEIPRDNSDLIVNDSEPERNDNIDEGSAPEDGADDDDNESKLRVFFGDRGT